MQISFGIGLSAEWLRPSKASQSDPQMYRTLSGTRNWKSNTKLLEKWGKYPSSSGSRSMGASVFSAVQWYPHRLKVSSILCSAVSALSFVLCGSHHGHSTGAAQQCAWTAGLVGGSLVLPSFSPVFNFSILKDLNLHRSSRSMYPSSASALNKTSSVQFYPFSLPHPTILKQNLDFETI